MYITFFDKQNCVPVTYLTDVLTEKNLGVISRLEGRYEELAEKAKEFIGQPYFTYYKRKEFGYRVIHIPGDTLKNYMREVNKLLLAFNFYFPDQMYGYIRNRSIKQLVNIHKDSQYFLKLDIKNFFDSCTYDFVMKSLSEVYPFCLFINYLAPIVKACMFNDRLPQGAPTSPILSNIAMIPSIYIINEKLKGPGKHDLHFHYNFTIYADDITISIHGKETLPKMRMKVALGIVKDTLKKNTPLILNSSKTKFSCLIKSKGVHLHGLTISHEHKVTIGSKKKQVLKATIFSFLADAKNGNLWSAERTESMYGWISYLRYIEPEYVDMTIQKYNNKLKMDFISTIHDILYS